jgi:hypothetical protein
MLCGPGYMLLLATGISVGMLRHEGGMNKQPGHT